MLTLLEYIYIFFFCITITQNIFYLLKLTSIPIYIDMPLSSMAVSENTLDACTKICHGKTNLVTVSINDCVHLQLKASGMYLLHLLWCQNSENWNRN